MKKKKTVVIKFGLVILNIILVLTAVVVSLVYSKNIQKEQRQQKLDAFCSTIESMKQISGNYLQMELNYAKDWAKYIDEKQMTMDEALAYINMANHQKDRYAHIVDMDTYNAYSTCERDGSNEINCYKEFLKNDSATYQLFLSSMDKMMTGDDQDYNILGKYRADDTQLNVISMGTAVTLTTEDGTRKSYLLLRVIPVESMRKIWVFPVEYKDAEVGIITKTGDYVVQSNAMKSRTFNDFIRGYNFEDDYNKVDDLVAELTGTDHGILRYKDSRGRECFWYYSSFSEHSGIHILGYLPVAALKIDRTDWTIVAMTCGILFLLILLDGSYVLHMNHRLKETAQMAEAANEAKTRFLSTMSHDIRTPMNGIIGMTNIALHHAEDTEYVKQCLKKVSLASDQLLTLVNDILDISKVESGKMMLNPASCSLDVLLERLISMMQVQMREKEITFSVKKELPIPWVLADELRLNQIFMNILTNAIKYTPQGGSIQMKIKEELRDPEQVALTYQVSDNGVGMSEEFQKNMYQTFSREADSRINKIQGSGLGLSIVKQMVDMMEGTINCESTPGEGTTFTVKLLLKLADQTERDKENGTQREVVAEDRFPGIRVLVAEDNDLNWEIIQDILKSYQVDADRVENGALCLERLEEDPSYDLVFMDVQMPVMNGKEAVRRIRQHQSEKIRRIPVVAMTADAFAEDVQACIDAGMNGHIAKPVDVRKVREVLRKIAAVQKR